MVALLEDFLSPSESARALGVSAATVKLWIDSGRLRGVRTSNGRLADAADVQRLALERAAVQQEHSAAGAPHGE